MLQICEWKMLYTYCWIVLLGFSAFTLCPLCKCELLKQCSLSYLYIYIYTDNSTIIIIVVVPGSIIKSAFAI